MKFISFLKRLGAFLTIVLWLGTIVFSFYLGMVWHWATTTEIKDSKDYSEIAVKENDIAGYKVFIEIPEEYGALEQIEEPVRKTISLYMKANNLKLAEGTHTFSRRNGSLDEYINEEFTFEIIEDEDVQKNN